MTTAKSRSLAFILVAGVLNGCSLNWKEQKHASLPAPIKHFVAVYKREKIALEPDGHQTVETTMETVMSDGQGCVRYGDRHQNVWSLHDYKQQVTYEVNNSKHIYVKSDGVGWWDVVEPSRFISCVPDIGGYQCQFLGSEKVGPYFCRHYAIRYDDLMSKQPVGWDEWWSPELNCSVKGGTEMLVRYDSASAESDLFQIPKDFLLVSQKEFNQQRKQAK